MKGNEARIIFFLHPVKEFKGGQMSKEKPKSIIPRLRSTLPFLGIALVLGVLTFVVYTALLAHILTYVLCPV